MRVEVDKTRVTGTFRVYAFKIHGALSYRIGGLLPLNDKQPAFTQLYVFDPLEANICRGEYINGLLPGFLATSKTFLRLIIHMFSFISRHMRF